MLQLAGRRSALVKPCKARRLPHPGARDAAGVLLFIRKRNDLTRASGIVNDRTKFLSMHSND